jgi:DNA-binding MarR family transcriptional regulator
MPQVSPLEAHLGFWLRYVSNHVTLAFQAKLATLDVGIGEWVMLRALFDHDELAPSELAESMGMTRGAGTADRRWHRLALTAPGRRLVPRLAALADRNDVVFFGHLAPEDRALIEATMRDIVERHGLRAVPMA